MGAPMPRILVIDDDAHVAETFRRMLTVHGYEVATAYGAEWGLRLVDLFQPDAVLVDLRMPRVSGLGFLQQLRARGHHRRIPVAMVTGDYFVEQSIVDDVSALDGEVCFKPLRLDELIALANRLLQRSYHDRDAVH
jgi:DNA-binding response OmpR family regulator